MITMGAYDLTYTCDASTYEDVVYYFDKLIEKNETSGYDSDDPYCGNVTSFHGIKRLNGFAKNYEEANKEVLDNSEKWGPAVVKFYYNNELLVSLENGTVSKNDIKKIKNKNIKIREKVNKENEKILKKIDEFCNKMEVKHGGVTSCVSCKSKISNDYVKRCIGISRGYGNTSNNYYNKCCICSMPFIILNETKLNSCKKDYNEISHIYKAVLGGRAAS